MRRNIDTASQNQTLIGLSVSACFGEIAEGFINEEDVDFVMTPARAQSREDWERVIQHYRKNYWITCAGDAEEIFWRFFEEGRIRNADYVTDTSDFSLGAYNIGRGHWVETEKAKEWLDDQLNDGHIVLETYRNIMSTLEL